METRVLEVSRQLCVEPARLPVPLGHAPSASWNGICSLGNSATDARGDEIRDALAVCNLREIGVSCRIIQGNRKPEPAVLAPNPGLESGKPHCCPYQPADFSGISNYFLVARIPALTWTSNVPCHCPLWLTETEQRDVQLNKALFFFQHLMWELY